MKRLEFYKYYSWAADKLGGMCTPETAIFSVIYSYYEGEKSCFISYKGFSNLLGISERTVQRAVKRLEAIGVIYVSWSNFTDSKEYEINDSMTREWENSFIAELPK